MRHLLDVAPVEPHRVNGGVSSVDPIAKAIESPSGENVARPSHLLSGNSRSAGARCRRDGSENIGSCSIGRFPGESVAPAPRARK